jgi:L-lactate dehydrogenase complex protein LldG
MSDKNEILKKIHQAQPAPLPYPAWEFAADCAGLTARFVQSVEDSGAACLTARDFAEAQQQLEAQESFAEAGRICCVMPELSLGNVDLGDIAHPRELADLDLTVAAGQLSVAENGAIWVVPPPELSRVALFSCERLVLLVPASELVADLHQAYARLDFSFKGAGYLIAGPSKTADIEQVLVLGAQGPRALTVVLVEVWP